MSKNRNGRSFIYGDKKPSRLVEIIYKVFVSLLWTFLYITIFGFIIGVISKYIKNGVLIDFLNSLIPISYVLSVLTMKKIFKDDFDLSLRINSFGELLKYIFLGVLLVGVSYILFILINKPGGYLFNENLDFSFLISNFSNIIYSLGITYLFVGYFYNLIKKKYNFYVALIFTSIIYGLIFLINRGLNSLLIPMVISILKMSLMILIYEISRSFFNPLGFLSSYEIIQKNILSISGINILGGSSLVYIFDGKLNLISYEFGIDNLIYPVLVLIFVNILIFTRLKAFRNK